MVEILKKTLALIVVGLGVAGCQTQPVETMSYADQQKLISQILDRCPAEGARAGTPAEKDCFAQEVRAEQYKRTLRRQAWASLGSSASCTAITNGDTQTLNCY